MSVAINWANKMQLAKCDIMVGFPISSHIYHMNHGHYGVYSKHTTLVLGHWKFAVDKPLSLGARGLSMANFL